MKQIDFSKLKVNSIRSRKSKVDRSQLAVSLESKGVAAFIDSLPDILRARDLKALTATIIAAKHSGKPILWMFGAHVVKVGLAPVLCEIMQKGFAQQISTNNAGLIHDLELAFFGSTSEDVEAAITAGQFGMTRETGELYAGILSLADEREIGLGEAAGMLINGFKAKYRSASVFATAQRLQIPATVHVAIGTDVVSAHEGYDGAKAGAASQIDFRIFCENVRHLKNGGVALNFGSAVILPEVFLKAIAIARNLDPRFTKFTAANFDMISLYRPHNNFVKRPRLLGATAYDFAGHHEIMLPLIWAVVRDRLKMR
jgi:hypothetical protein